MLKLVCLHKFNETDKKKLVDNLKDLYNITFPENFTEENLSLKSQNADVLLGVKASRRIILEAKEARLFQSISAGVNKVNQDALKECEIILCNSHSNSFYVAEHALSLLLSLTKRIIPHHRRITNLNNNLEVLILIRSYHASTKSPSLRKSCRRVELIQKAFWKLQAKGAALTVCNCPRSSR